MNGYTGHPRVVATVNIVVMAGLGALLVYMDSNVGRPFRRGTGFYLGIGFICLFELFWIWIFIANPRDWAKVEDGRLRWRRGQIFPSQGSVAVNEVSYVLVEDIITSSNDKRPGKMTRYWVVLKDGSRLRVPEQAVGPEVLHPMRLLNPSIERKSESRPWTFS